MAQFKYDKDMDKLLFSRKEVVSDGQELFFEIKKYGDTGTPKINLVRKRVNKDGSVRVAGIGRIVYDEIEIVITNLELLKEELKKEMDKSRRE